MNDWIIDYLGLDEEYFNEERIKSLIHDKIAFLRQIGGFNVRLEF